jgi:hypothetical protein
MVKYLDGNGRGLIEVLSWHLHGGSKENHEVPIRIASVSAAIGEQQAGRYHAINPPT